MKAVNQISISEKLICFHCGEECSDNEIKINEKVFCCNGCKTVYELLDANDLCTYYSIDENPGLTQKNDIKKNFDFLDDSDLKDKLIDFTDGKITSITFSIPQVHCSSCIWILENLYKMDSGIIHSEANFLKKIVSIKFDESKTSLKKIVILLRQHLRRLDRETHDLDRHGAGLSRERVHEGRAADMEAIADFLLGAVGCGDDARASGHDQHFVRAHFPVLPGHPEDESHDRCDDDNNDDEHGD